MKPTIVQYSIPGNESGGLLHIYGEATAASNNVILYCGGWPDGVEPFAPMAMRLAASSNSTSDTSSTIEHQDGCFVGITCWPGFDAEFFKQQLKFRAFKREGYNFDQVASCIREAAKQLFVEYYRRHNGKRMTKTTTTTSSSSSSSSDTVGVDDEREKPQFTVIFHDFGVLPGLMFVNRSIEINADDFGEYSIIPDRIVLLDVLLEPHEKFKSQHWRLSPYTTRELSVYLAYRGTFACAFAMLRFLSETFGLFTFRIMYAFVIMLGLAPLDPRGHDVRLLAERMMDQYHLIYTFYPYYHMFQALIFNKHDVFHGCLPLDLVKTPILYLYGEEKNVMFHDHRSLAILQQEERDGTSDCRVVKITGAGHWMYCQKPDICEKEIRKFIKTKKQ